MLDRRIRARSDSAAPIVSDRRTGGGHPVVECGATSCQWSASAGVTSSSPAISTAAPAGASRGTDGSPRREQLRDVGAFGGVLERRDLGQLSVLLRELGGRRDLDHLGVAERALREGREPTQRLDLVAEQVDPDGAVLGCREQVEQASADRELAAVLDLIDALIAGGDQLAGGLVEIQQLPARSVKPWGRRAGSGTFSDSATALTTTTGASAPSRGRRARRARRSGVRPGAAAAPDATRR